MPRQFDVDLLCHIAVVDGDVVDGNQKRAPSVHGVAGIERKIDQGRLKLHGIDQNASRIGREFRLDLDLATNRAFHNCKGILAHRAQIGRDRFEIAPARKDHQPRREIRAHLGRIQSILDQRRHTFIGVAQLHEFQIADDHSK